MLSFKILSAGAVLTSIPRWDRCRTCVWLGFAIVLDTRAVRGSRHDCGLVVCRFEWWWTEECSSDVSWSELCLGFGWENVGSQSRA